MRELVVDDLEAAQKGGARGHGQAERRCDAQVGKVLLKRLDDEENVAPKVNRFSLEALWVFRGSRGGAGIDDTYLLCIDENGGSLSFFVVCDPSCEQMLGEPCNPGRVDLLAANDINILMGGSSEPDGCAARLTLYFTILL